MCTSMTIGCVKRMVVMLITGEGLGWGWAEYWAVSCQGLGGVLGCVSIELCQSNHTLCLCSGPTGFALSPMDLESSNSEGPRRRKSTVVTPPATGSFCDLESSCSPPAAATGSNTGPADGERQRGCCRVHSHDKETLNQRLLLCLMSGLGCTVAMLLSLLFFLLGLKWSVLSTCLQFVAFLAVAVVGLWTQQYALALGVGVCAGTVCAFLTHLSFGGGAGSAAIANTVYCGPLVFLLMGWYRSASVLLVLDILIMWTMCILAHVVGPEHMTPQTHALPQTWYAVLLVCNQSVPGVLQFLMAAAVVVQLRRSKLTLSRSKRRLEVEQTMTHRLLCNVFPESVWNALSDVLDTVSASKVRSPTTVRPAKRFSRGFTASPRRPTRAKEPAPSAEHPDDTGPRRSAPFEPSTTGRCSHGTDPGLTAALDPADDARRGRCSPNPSCSSPFVDLGHELCTEPRSSAAGGAPNGSTPVIQIQDTSSGTPPSRLLTAFPMNLDPPSSESEEKGSLPGLIEDRLSTQALHPNPLHDPATPVSHRIHALVSQRLAPKEHPFAVILFADIVGFTALASTSHPTTLVRFLDQFFGRIDDVCKSHGVEKIKTIGDCYMCVGWTDRAAGGGAGGQSSPEHEAVHDDGQGALRMAANAHQVLLVAKAMHAVIQQTPVNGARLSIRAGMHIGTVISGIIGKSKFIFDIWGDAVNVASRMESTGVAGATQISADLHELLKDKEAFQRRGLVQVKGKGAMETYLLTAPAPKDEDAEPDISSRARLTRAFNAVYVLSSLIAEARAK